MKKPEKIIMRQQGLGIKGLLAAITIPAILIVSTMFYSVDQLNTAGEREAVLSDSLNVYRAMVPAAVFSLDTIIQRDTVQIAGKDTVLQKDTIITSVSLPAQQTLTGIWADSVAQLGGSMDREALIKLALKRFPGYTAMEKELRAKGYFRLAGAEQSNSTSSIDRGTRGSSANERRTNDLAIRERVLISRGSRTNPVFIVLNPLKN